MARTTTATKVAKTPSIETKALAADTKSAGMRVLYEAGYTVAQVAKVFGVGYAFAYGVAQRAGKASTAASRRPVKAAAPKAKATTKPAAAKAATAKATKATTTETLTPGQKAYRARKAKAAVEAAKVNPKGHAGKVIATVVKAAPVKARATSASTVAKVAAKVAAKSGRPSPERRAANRKPRVAATA